MQRMQLLVESGQEGGGQLLGQACGFKELRKGGSIKWRDAHLVPSVEWSALQTVFLRLHQQHLQQQQQQQGGG
jgi:hypothetical protein